MKSERFLQSPFKGKSVHSAAIFAMFPGSYFGHQRPSYMNGGIRKSQKLLLNFKSATKSEINCRINCYLCSKSVKKAIFFRLDKAMRMCSHKRESLVFMGTGASNSSCIDAMTLPISDWLFHLEGGTYSTTLCIEVSPILPSNRNEQSLYIVFGFLFLHWQSMQLPLWSFKKFIKRS